MRRVNLIGFFITDRELREASYPCRFDEFPQKAMEYLKEKGGLDDSWEITSVERDTPCRSWEVYVKEAGKTVHP